MKLVLHGRPLKARDALAAAAMDHLVAAADDLADAARAAIRGEIAKATPTATGDLAAAIDAERAALLARTRPENMPAPLVFLTTSLPMT